MARLKIDTSATTNTDEQTHAIATGSGVHDGERNLFDAVGNTPATAATRDDRLTAVYAAAFTAPGRQVDAAVEVFRSVSRGSGSR